MRISTTNEYNIHAACAGCCPLPDAPAPQRECLSIRGDFKAVGFKDEMSSGNLLYSIEGNQISVSGRTTLYNFFPPSNNYYISHEGTVETYKKSGYGYSRRYQGGIGHLNESGSHDCLYWGAPEGYEICDFGGAVEFKYYSMWITGGGPPDGYTFSRDLTQLVKISYVTPLNSSEEVGTCELMQNTEVTVFPEYWGYDSEGGTSDPPADPEAFAAWVAGNRQDDPPCAGSHTVSRLVTEPYLTQSLPDIIASSHDIYEGGFSSEDFAAEVDALMPASARVADPLCTSAECSALLVMPGEDVASDWFFTRRRVSYKMCVPWEVESGSDSGGGPRYFAVQWDEVFFPIDYDLDGSGASPVIMNSRFWEWAGDWDVACSEWFDMADPPASGEVRVVNVITKLYPTQPFPTSHGEVVDV